jgi:EmrB/QacA subfamily drug resistance transporter
MSDRRQTRSRLVVLVAVGAAFMSSLDLFVVNVAFDDIGASLGVNRPEGPTAADLSWVLNAYAVTYAALLVPFGRLADRYGRKHIFVGGLLLFTSASVACALSGSVWLLVVSRILQAAGAAAMTPTSLSILLAALPAERRMGGVRLWAATGAIAAAIGPSVGGLLTQLGWQWVFLINLPVGAALVVLALREVHEVRPDEEAGVPDLLGAALFAGSVGLLALGLVKSPEWGWLSGRTALALGLALALGILFALRSVRHPSPVIHPELLRVSTFRWAILTMVLFNVSFAINLLAGILWLQQIWGYSALRTGFAVAVGPVLVPVTAALSHRFLATARPARLITVGSLVLALSASFLALRMGPGPSYLTSYLPGWLLGGVGVGLALPNLMAGATHDLGPHLAATGSGVVNMARQIGFVVGVSVLFAIVGDGIGRAAMDAFTTCLLVAAAVLVAASVAAYGMAARVRPRAPSPARGGPRVR